MLSRSIENAQRKVEAYNFDVRKQLLEYDDVANEQRKVIYSQRDELLSSHSIAEAIGDIGNQVIHQTISTFIPEHSMEEEWDIPGLEQQLESDFNLKLPIKHWLEQDETIDEEHLREKIKTEFRNLYKDKEVQVSPEIM